MGVDMYIGRISGKVARDDVITCFILFKNGKFRKATDKEINDDDPRIVHDDKKLCENLTKAVSEEYFNKLESDIYNHFGRCRMSMRVLPHIEKFWESIDKWTNDRDNEILINQIKEYLY